MPDDFSPPERDDWRAERRDKDRARRRRRVLLRRTVAGLIVVAAVVAVVVVASGSFGQDGTSSPSPPAASGTSDPKSDPTADATVTSKTATTAPPVKVPTAAERRQAKENAAINRVLRYTWFVTRGSKRKREIALTFDDGPGPYTEGVVKVLKKYHVPATFFQVGFMIPDFPDALKQQVRAGFVLGDHTESHLALAGKPSATQKDQIVTQTQWLKKYHAPYPKLFRPPYGVADATTRKILKRARMLAVFWTVDTDDYKQPGVPAIVHTALSGAENGAIILMHDAGGTRTQTIAALPTIVKGLRKKGYTLVSVPTLLADDPPPRHQKAPTYLTGG